MGGGSCFTPCLSANRRLCCGEIFWTRIVLSLFCGSGCGGLAWLTNLFDQIPVFLVDGNQVNSHPIYRTASIRVSLYRTDVPCIIASTSKQMAGVLQA